VRRHLCKRLKLRIGELDLDGFAAYRKRLDFGPEEWRAFDECHITAQARAAPRAISPSEHTNNCRSAR
jgi:hypothetical protein